MKSQLKTKSELCFQLDEIYVKSSEFVKSPFRYPGGKFYALKYIIPFLDCVPHHEYREPFVGGGSVFFGKRKAQVNWINDLESNLIVTYKAMANADDGKWLIEAVSKEIASKERHHEIKGFTPLTEREIAFKTYYLNRTTYSGIIHKPAWGYGIGYSSPPENWWKFIEDAGKKLTDVKITNQDFSKIIASKSCGGDVLMYLDPPYYLADQKRAYTKSFLKEDHVRLAKQLENTEHYFCLSYDDCKEIRDLYKWANIYERSWFYNTANSKGPRMVGNELIITNYEVHQTRQAVLI